jgi:nucleotide-binding universal stress UspA family protein
MSTSPVILHPTDFSEPAGHAFHLACALAHRQGARLLVLHVPAPLPAAIDPRQVGNPFDTLRKQLEQFRPEPPDVSVEYRVTPGDAAEEIVNSARQTGCALIVMGTQGRSGLARMLMGSVAEQVVRNAPCPVVTERLPPREPAAAAEASADAAQQSAQPSAAATTHTILHPTDFSEPCAQALRVAVALAREQSARMILLHVIVPPRAGLKYMPIPPPVSGASREELEEMLRGLRASVPDNIPVDCRLAEGEKDAAKSIVDVAHTMRCDLTVMGTNGRGWLGRALLGSIAEQVMRTAPCPVVTVRASRGA